MDATKLQPKVPDHELIRRIGQGSYGEVWLARNVMGTFRAVKVVYRENFSDERPFRREFSGLEKFEPISRSHEGLVHVLQIGRSDSEGYFYYVMELGDDVNATSAEQASSSTIRPDNYAPKTLRTEIESRGRLPVQECVRIGLSLSSALDFLHRCGLVHRDIKPSNIVFVNGQPKLADVGLVTEQSEAKSFVGTEGFIPPEGPGTPQADIFSLGKVLYEISSGKDRHSFPEPPTQLGEFPDRKELLELDEVIGKACHSDPRQRYNTAEEMEADLLLLRTGRSVRETNQLRRRLAAATRIGLVAGVVALLALGGYLFAQNQNHKAQETARRETELRRQAEAARAAAQASETKAAEEAQKSRQVARFLEDMLKGVTPSVARGRDTVLLREILATTLQRISRDLTNQPAVDSQLRSTIGTAYLGIGDYTNAETLYREALTIQKNINNSSGPESGMWLSALSEILVRQGKILEAEAPAREGLAIQRKLHANEHLDLAYALSRLAFVLDRQDKLVEAEALQREALAIYQKLLGSDSLLVAESLDRMGGILSEQNRLPEAEAVERQAVETILKIDRQNPTALMYMMNLANILQGQGKIAEAESLHRQALVMKKKIYAVEHPAMSDSINNLVFLLIQEDKKDEAEAVAREWLHDLRQRLPSKDKMVGVAILLLMDVLFSAEKFAEAEPLAREYLALHQNINPGKWPVFNAMSLLGGCLLGQKKYAEAEPMLIAGYNGLAERENTISVFNKPRLKEAINKVATLYQEIGRHKEAAEWKEKANDFPLRPFGPPK